MNEKKRNRLIKAGADIITFSVEYCADVKGTLDAIEHKDLLVGLSVNPSTQIDVIEEFMGDIDVVVLLAIGPDTGSCNFISELPERISQLRKLKKDILVFVDGAIKKDNIAEVAAMGPDVIVTGSATNGISTVCLRGGRHISPSSRLISWVASVPSARIFQMLPTGPSGSSRSASKTIHPPSGEYEGSRKCSGPG